MVYDTTSQQHHSYPQPTPTHATVPHLVLPSVYESPLDKALCYSDCPPLPIQGRLTNSLYGSTSLPNYPPLRLNRNLSDQYCNSTRMESSRSNRSLSQGSWDSATAQPLVPMSTPLAHSSSQPSFSSVSNKEPGGAIGRTKSTKRPQGSSSKRPTADDFRNLVLCPRDREALLLYYVGTDARYTLAKNHAGMMVRASIKSDDIAIKMREAAEPLDSIDIFLGFLLDYQGIKQEQKGCLALRICIGALTALLGDFSQGNGTENFASDPQAAVVPKGYLARCKTFDQSLPGILVRLATKLEKSMNLYRHRRSPSSSLVAKFQEMSDTLDVWNQHLGDGTFAAPYRIAFDWLKNHPNQVDTRRRNQAYNEQASPSLSDTTRPSPTQCDSNFLSPMSVYAEASRGPNMSNMRATNADVPGQYEDSLFKPPTGVTFYGSTSMASSSPPFNPAIYRNTSFDENLGIPALTPDDFRALTHHEHPSSTGQYHTTGSGYSF
ncbi:unnamed protein product [Rhizoctonia solani]|uniref:Uncharacterized protein n=1 Tax=Rhizoctonia solani TaxID=456999 RepID=A0A8H3HH02_9AGAM|nr:unnamed protein product [Rhizoctonia solani]